MKNYYSSCYTTHTQLKKIRKEKKIRRFKKTFVVKSIDM